MWDRATNVIYASAMTREDHRSNLLFTFVESAFRSGVRSKLGDIYIYIVV